MERDTFTIINVRRKATYVKLTAAKKIGFLGAIALLFNAATGPGLPFTPANFQSPGYVITILCFLIFAFVSGFSILFIIEAMQAIPGNKHFQGDVEYATLINFYFGRWAHIAGQLLLYGALQSNAIQGIVLSAQSIDSIFIDLFGKTCGLSIAGKYTGWICVADQSADYPSPFENTWMLFTLGLVVVIMIAVPLGLSNLDDNMWVQYLAFCVSIIMIIQWMSTSFVVGFDSSRLVAAAPLGIIYGQVVGTVLLNLAITTIIPSWINIKRKDVNVQQSVWISISCITFFYILSGLILAGGYDNIQNNVMTTLLQFGKPPILTKFMVYIFSFVMLIPSIPVNLIISKENLFQNELLSDRLSMVVSFLLPLLVVIPFQTGNSLILFQSWTSTLFVSPSNFMIPVIIYFRCVEFRTKYNIDHELSAKQIDLLKRIHSKSKSLVKHLRRKKNFLTDYENAINSNEESKPSFPRSPEVLQVANDLPGPSEPIIPLQLENENSTAAGLQLLIDENVPNPDQEDREAGRQFLNPNSFVDRLVTTIGRKKAKKQPEKGPEIEIEVAPPVDGHGDSTITDPNGEGLEILINENVPNPDQEDEEEGREYLLTRLVTTLGRGKSKKPLETPPFADEIEIGVLPSSAPRLETDDAFGMSPTSVSKASKTSPTSLQVPGIEVISAKENSKENQQQSRLFGAHSDISIEPVGKPVARTNAVNPPANNLSRLKTLPTHPNFKSPAFRSVPKWIPLRGLHMAWVVLVLTSVVTLGNLIILFIPS